MISLLMTNQEEKKLFLHNKINYWIGADKVKRTIGKKWWKFYILPEKKLKNDFSDFLWSLQIDYQSSVLYKRGFRVAQKYDTVAIVFFAFFLAILSIFRVGEMLTIMFQRFREWKKVDAHWHRYSLKGKSNFWWKKTVPLNYDYHSFQ
jgi:hypothetical protein